MRFIILSQEPAPEVPGIPETRRRLGHEDVRLIWPRYLKKYLQPLDLLSRKVREDCTLELGNWPQ